MLFNSFEFLFFLPIVIFLFYLLPNRFRIPLLIIASLYFYMSWNPFYILLMLATAFTNYFAGISLGKIEDVFKRKLILTATIVFNIGILGCFKYTNFIIENINFISNRFHLNQEPIQFLSIILPVGISFYTFHTLSYTIDVYRNTLKPERNISVFILYVCFFPLLVAGPIERFGSIMPQFKIKAFLSKENISSGFRMILFGFFLKMVIADNIGIIVDSTYANIQDTNSLNLIITSVLYSFQIYCDFNGYTIIALGVAKLLSINLTQNFKSPYFSYSLTSFWRKWHITLTTWFRDYIYYPLGGNKTTKIKWIIAILVVFITSGFWHGANWVFVIWGISHGVIIIVEKILNLDKKSNSNFINLLRGFITFSIVTALWIVFRSPNIGVSRLFFEKLVSNWNLKFESLSLELICLVVLFLLFDLFTRKNDFSQWINEKSFIFRWSVYFILGFLILSRSGTDMKPFIYFQF